MIKLYENIKYYRKLNNMTQEELAKKAGYTDRSSIAKIESGIVDISQSKIAQFADIFGITSSDLMGWEENEELATVTVDKLTQEIIKKLDALTPENRSIALAQLDFLLDRQEKQGK